MKRLLLGIGFCLLASSFALADGVRTTVSFKDGWTFQLAAKEGVRKAEVNTKTVGDTLDSETWETAVPVRLPHDWAISGPFDEASTNGGQGKLPWRGVGLYTKTFRLEEADAGKQVRFQFDGCMAFPEVYINGTYAGGWDYGYTPFEVDATPFVKFGAENTIQVRCDTRHHGSRWYPGAGIYREVKLVLCSSDAWFEEGAVFLSTKEILPEEDAAVLQWEVEPSQRGNQELSMEMSMIAPDGRPVKDFQGMQKTKLAPGTNRGQMKLTSVTLWDVDHPVLYTVCVRLFADGKLCDEISFPFGIRTMEYTSDKGFFLNGKRLQLKGVDLHHDQGILGAASHPAAIERQLRIMKEMGVNAVRTSHNPNSAAFMDACDRMGFVVWNELFDKWNHTADLLDQNTFDAFTDRQVRAFVYRDRNRPCVSMWSIGNEIVDIESNKVGDSNPFNDAARRVKHVGDRFRHYDPTRQVGLGCCVCGASGNGVRDSLDIIGGNYNAQYRSSYAVYPTKCMVYSESASAVSTRGYYELPHPQSKAAFNETTHQVDGYDFASVPWGDIPEPEFERMIEDPFCAGEFVWTGFDYLGEPSPFNAEARSSYFGIVDLCGIPKDRFYIYRSHWNPENTTVHIVPHWNWENRGFANVPVFVYTNGDSVELFLNGKSLGKKTKLTERAEPNNVASAPETVVTASTEEKKDPRGNFNAAANVVLPLKDQKRWCASSEQPNQWLTVDLGSVKKIYTWTVLFENACNTYQYSLLTSSDGENWTEVFAQKNFESKDGQKTLHFETPVEARYFKVQFHALREGAWASIRWIRLDDEPTSASELPEYYAIVDKYRLRWEDIPFEPGTLEAVAYRNGEEIGRAVVRTAKEAAKIRLTPEKAVFSGSDDLIYVLAEAVDDDGNVCPWDSRKFFVQVEGPAELVGIGNGNPMGYETLTDAEHSLFYGKAMIVLRSTPGDGNVRLNVQSDGVTGMEVELKR